MARATVVHSQDACTIVFKGNPKSPEPTSGIVKFPGGHVEVSRNDDNSYWIHVQVEGSDRMIDSRIDYDIEYARVNGIPEIKDADHINHIAVRVK